ncbi:MAG: DUF2240 family protein [Promethearchaeota archaeon]
MSRTLRGIGERILNLTLEEIVSKVVNKSKLTRKKVLERVTKKKNELGGLITDEGAACIIAKELGVDVFEGVTYEEGKLRIVDLVTGMTNVSITGRVLEVHPVREFTRSDGQKGTVTNIILADGSGKIRVVFWDKHAEKIIEGKIRKGQIIRILKGYTREGLGEQLEINLGRYSDVAHPKDVSSEEYPEVSETRVNIVELKPDMFDIRIAGVVKRVFPRSVFQRKDGTEGQVLSLIIADKTGTIRTVFWNDKVGDVSEVEVGDILKIERGYTRSRRDGGVELHAGPSTQISINPKLDLDLPEVETGGRVKISQLSPDMFDVNVLARILSIGEIRDFARRDGTQGRMATIIIQDDSATISTVLWSDHADLTTDMKSGDTILIEKGYARSGPFGLSLNVGQQGSIKINPEDEPSILPKELEVTPLDGLKRDLSSVAVRGKVIEVSDVREFSRSDGSTGQLLSLTIADETGSVRVVAWDNLTKKIGSVKKDDILLIKNAYTRVGIGERIELHLGRLAEVEINPKGIKISEIDISTKITAELPRMRITDLSEQDVAEVMATIVQVYRKNLVYTACPNCFKKVSITTEGVECPKCGPLETSLPRMVVSTTIDDGSDTIRANFIGEVAEILVGIDAEEAFRLEEEQNESLHQKLQDLTGKTLILSGRVVHNEFTGESEFNVTAIQKPSPKKEAKRLIKKVKKSH